MLGAFIIGAVFLVWVLIPKGGSDNEAVKEEPVQVEEQAEEETKTEETKPAEKEEKETKEVAKVEEPAPQKLTAVGTSGRTTTYELADADKFEVTVSSKGETWVIISDGNQKKYFNNMLKSGESKTFDLAGQTEAKIVVGFAPDAEIKVNGETVNYKLPADQQVRQDILIQMKKAGQ
nr:DUF4115 domain-containing protein [Bacillus ectoiniformans]